MSDRWVSSPLHMPRRCHRMGTSNEESGPYFEHNWAYYDADPNAVATGEVRHNTLYQSTEWIRHMLEQEGSPFAPITTADAQRMEEEIRNLNDRVESLVRENDELRADLLIAREQEHMINVTDEDIERLAALIRPSAPKTKRATA